MKQVYTFTRAYVYGLGAGIKHQYIVLVPLH